MKLDKIKKYEEPVRKSNMYAIIANIFVIAAAISCVFIPFLSIRANILGEKVSLYDFSFFDTLKEKTEFDMFLKIFPLIFIGISVIFAIIGIVYSLKKQSVLEEELIKTYDVLKHRQYKDKFPKFNLIGIEPLFGCIAYLIAFLVSFSQVNENLTEVLGFLLGSMNAVNLWIIIPTLCLVACFIFTHLSRGLIIKMSKDIIKEEYSETRDFIEKEEKSEDIKE